MGSSGRVASAAAAAAAAAAGTGPKDSKAASAPTNRDAGLGSNPFQHRLIVAELQRQHSILTAQLSANALERERLKKGVHHRWLSAIYSKNGLL